MREEHLQELRKFTPPKRHPSAFATPVLALLVAGVVSASAAYASYLHGNLYEVLDNDHRVNDFEYIVSHSTLESSFQEDNWEYTVVAPTDQAFDKAQWQSAALMQGVSSAPSVEPEYSNISAYDYVLSTPIYPEDVKFGEHIRTPALSGNDLVFSRISDGDDGLRVNGLPVNAVRTADNGVVYLIDDIISVPSAQSEQQLTMREERE